jgi:hypothetical protein
MSAVFEPLIMAESLMNALTGAGLAIVARANQRVDPRGPVSRRVVFALSLVSAFFFARAAGWIAGSDPLARLATALAGATPLAALWLAEGLLRRHAPPAMKIALTAGCVLIAALAALFPQWTTLDEILLLVDVVGGYAALAWLLLNRDRTIRRLLVALPFLLLTLLTDFRGLFPAIPMRLGALGVAVLIYSCFGANGLSAPGRTRIFNLAGFLVIAAALALGFAATQNVADGALDFMIAAVVFCGLVLAGLASEEIGARSERARAPSPLLDAADSRAFEAALKGDPILQDARIFVGAELADVVHPELVALLTRRPILLRREAPWRMPPDCEGVERAMSLLLTYDATHLMRLGSAPLRIAAFAVPSIADDPRTEMEIVVAQRLGEALYAKTPSHD